MVSHPDRRALRRCLLQLLLASAGVIKDDERKPGKAARGQQTHRRQQRVAVELRHDVRYRQQRAEGQQDDPEEAGALGFAAVALPQGRQSVGGLALARTKPGHAAAACVALVHGYPESGLLRDELGLGVADLLDAGQLAREVRGEVVRIVGGHRDTKVARSAKVLHTVVLLAAGLLTACVPARRQLPEILREISGVASVGTVDFAHNDSGNAARLYVLSSREQPMLAEEKLAAGVRNVDWEAATVLPDGRLCICDIGDNRRVRPAIDFELVAADAPAVGIAARYPDRPHNAEACLVYGDWLCVLTKAPTGSRGARTAYLFGIPVAELGTGGGVRTLYRLDSLALPRRSVTDAAVVPGTGRLIVLSYDYRLRPVPLTATTLFAFELATDPDAGPRFVRTGEPPSRAAAAVPRQAWRVRAPFTPTQYEALALDSAGRRAWIASERTGPVPPRWRWIELDD